MSTGSIIVLVSGMVCLIIAIIRSVLNEIRCRKIDRLTPSNEELIELARKHPPAPEWYQEESEPPS